MEETLPTRVAEVPAGIAERHRALLQRWIVLSEDLAQRLAEVEHRAIAGEWAQHCRRHLRGRP